MKTIEEKFTILTVNKTVKKSILDFKGLDINKKEVKNSLETFIEIITGSMCNISIEIKEITNKNGHFMINLDKVNQKLIVTQVEQSYMIVPDKI